jgi:hypothetical protein
MVDHLEIVGMNEKVANCEDDERIVLAFCKRFETFGMVVLGIFFFFFSGL